MELELPAMVWVYEEDDDVTTAVPIYIGEILETQESISIPLASGRYSFAFVQENNKVLTFKDKI